MDEKIKALEAKLASYQKKLDEMAKQSIDSGGRYGDEYLIEQMQVYQRLISELKQEIAKLKRQVPKDR